MHDPEMRHGHKSKSRRFDGHKAAVVVDTNTQLITAVDVLPGNAPDNLGALELVEQSEASAGVPVSEAMGDTACGGGARQAFADAGRKLVARVPGRPDRKRFPKEDFITGLVGGSCACPAGQIARSIVPAGKRTGCTGTARKPCFKRRGFCGRAPATASTGVGGWRPGIAWLAWGSWASVRRAASDGSRPSSNCIWRPRWLI